MKKTVLLFILLITSIFSPITIASATINCSDAEIIFQDLSGVAEVKPAVLVTDPSGAAHLFWLYKVNKHDPETWSIDYKKWAKGNWTEESDILITPGGGAGAPRAVYTHNGRLHVIWADLYALWYSSVAVQDASYARSWTAPTLIASNVIDADIAADSTNRLHVVFASGQPTGPIYYINSQDGINWSKASIVYQDAPVEATSGEVRLSVDEAKRIHVTWTENQLPGGWPPSGQWYARSEDDGETWGDYKKVGDGEQGQGAILAVGENDVHLVWRGTSGTGNSYYTASKDGGKSWIDPIIFDPDGGFSGNHTLAVDSAGNLHLGRADGGYQVYQNGVWSPVPALFADSGEIGTIAIGLGNEVHWINTTPAGEKEAIIYHRLCKSDSPAVAAADLPGETFVKPSEELPLTPPTAPPPPTSDPLLNRTPMIVESTSQPVILAIVPIFVLIFGIAIIRSTRKK